MQPKDAITKLIARGWTESGIAEAVGSNQPTINRIKHGSRPSFAVGTAVIDLLRKEMSGRKKGREAA